MGIAERMVLSPEERSTLEAWEKGRRLPLPVVQRARIIRLAADGMHNQDVAKEVGVSCPTVPLWKQRFLALRLPGLQKDVPRPGPIARIRARKIRAVVEATLPTTPPEVTPGSTRARAQAQGLSEATIRRMGKQDNLQPHHPPAWTPPPPEVAELEALVRRLDALEQMRQQEANRPEVARPAVRPSIAEHLEFLQQQIG